MIDMDSSGSFLHEPAISEKALAQELLELSKEMPIDEKTEIERSFSLQIENQFADKDMLRTKKELSAILKHVIGDHLQAGFRLNPAWSTLDPTHLVFNLEGTTDLKGHLEKDEGIGVFVAYLEDASGVKIPRGEASLDVVNNIIDQLGISTRLISADGKGIDLWLQASSGREVGQHVIQRRTLDEREIDIEEDMSSSIAFERERIFNTEDLIDTVTLIETIISGEDKLARTTSTFNSQNGSSVTVREIRQNESTGEASDRPVKLDYDLIEKLLKNTRNAQLLASRQARL